MSPPSNANEKAIVGSPERAVRRALFIRALEEENDDGPLSRAAERFVEDEAGRNEVDLERIVFERAGIVQKDLERRWRVELTPLYAFDRRRSAVITAAIAALAFLIGLFSNVLDRGPVNVLLNAFMALLLWHVFVYLLMGVRAVFSRRLGKFLSDVRPGPVESALSWTLERLEDLLHRFTAARKAETWHKILSAQPRFRLYLAQYFNRVLRLRLMVRLNTFAIFSTLGVIAGMYLAGLIQDYRFTWYSTFIGEPETVAVFLRVVFAPVLFIFQRQLPNLAVQGVEIPGADWIHLFAQAALLYVVVPRSIIALLAHARARSNAQHFTLDLNDRYFADLLRPYRGKNLSVLPLAFSYTPDVKRSKRLRALLWNAFGERAELQDLRILAWDESFDVSTAKRSNTAVALLFNGVQTPEHEVHGALADQAVSWLRGTNGTGRLTVLVDTGDLEPDRHAERLKLWETVLLRAGIEQFNPVSLGDEADEGMRIHITGENN